MYLTITSFELKGPLHMFKLVGLSVKINNQMKASEGFIQFKRTGFWTSHYTMSLWKTEADMKSSAYLDIMKGYRDVASEVRTLTLAADKMPAWELAKEMVARNGKVVE